MCVTSTTLVCHHCDTIVAVRCDMVWSQLVPYGVTFRAEWLKKIYAPGHIEHANGFTPVCVRAYPATCPFSLNCLKFNASGSMQMDPAWGSWCT